MLTAQLCRHFRHHFKTLKYFRKLHHSTYVPILKPTFAILVLRFLPSVATQFFFVF